jgi:hypothetical protein
MEFDQLAGLKLCVRQIVLLLSAKRQADRRSEFLRLIAFTESLRANRKRLSRGETFLFIAQIHVEWAFLSCGSWRMGTE